MLFKQYYELLMENSAVRSYSCLMLDCANLAKDVIALQLQINPDDVYNDEPGHGLERDFHITVLYGIHEQTPDVVYSALDLSPQKYKFTELSLFENEKYDVLKFSVDSKGLHTLNEQVCDRLYYTNSFPDYKPHCTVAYLKPGTGKNYTKIKSPILGKTYESDTFIFSSKNGDKVYWKV